MIRDAAEGGHPSFAGGEPACSGADPELFYPLDHEYEASWERRAREVADLYCAGCPVRDACLAWALAVGEPGLWGGTVESERRRMRNRSPRREATA